MYTVAVPGPKRKSWLKLLPATSVPGRRGYGAKSNPKYKPLSLNLADQPDLVFLQTAVSCPVIYLDCNSSLPTDCKSPIIWALRNKTSEFELVKVVYTNDFAGTIGSEWSNIPTPIAMIGGFSRYLGTFGGHETVTLSLADLPAHSAITLTFDLFLTGSWDGDGTQYGPDYLSVSLPGEAMPLNRTFGAGMHHLTTTFDHSAGSLILSFSGDAADDKGERWGIVKIKVVAKH